MKINLKRGFALLLTLTMLLGMLAACTPQVDEPAEDDATYTYYSYMSTNPLTWNPHTWSTSTDYTIAGYTTMGLYTMDMNDTLDGYNIVAEMAAEMPVDVTAQYAGDAKWGIPADATEGYAYNVKLNPDAKWENGEPITADDYLYSYERLFSSDMKNYRANLYYSNNLSIYNAYNYFNQDKAGDSSTKVVRYWYDVYKDQIDAWAAAEDWDSFEAFAQQLVDEGTLYMDLVWAYWVNGPEDADYIIDGEDGQRLIAANDTTEFFNDYLDPVKDEGAENYYISADFIWNENKSWLMYDWYYNYKYLYVIQDVSIPEITFDDVGIIKNGDYELTYITSKPISMFDFEIALMDAPLVYEELYETCITDSGSKYGTSMDTWISYGPYKLTYYQADKQILMERNENWYGYTDGKHEGDYQTTAVNLQIVENQETALQLFLQGKLDGVSLTTANIPVYGTSDYLMYTPTDFTYRLTMNTNRESLETRQSEGKNKVILSYPEFRKAIALSMDRNTYCNGVYFGMQPAYGLWSNLHLVDAENGVVYNNTEAHKQVMLDLYGVDDISDITGYDKEQAKTLFLKAYEDALAAGDINETDIIALDFVAWGTDDTSMNEFNFYQASIDAAVAGTVLEGRIQLSIVPDSTNYYQRTYDGDFDLISVSWGGDTLSVFAQCEYYRDDYSNCSEYKWGSATKMITVNIDGKDVTKSYNDWTDALLNGEYYAADLDVRVEILAALERCLLENYITVPMDVSAGTSLRSQRIVFPVEEYVAQVGYGGIQHMTYTMSDAEWAEYCTEQNNQLTD